MSVRSSERGASLFEAILAIAVFVIGLGGGLFWLALITDTDEDKRLVENVGAIVEGLEAYTKDNWGPLLATDTKEWYIAGDDSTELRTTLPSFTKWVNWNTNADSSSLSDGEISQDRFYGIPWRVLRHYIKGEARNLSPVAEVDSPHAEDSCYQFVRDIPSPEDAPCVWLEGNGDNGVFALFDLRRFALVKNGKRILQKIDAPGTYGTYDEDFEGDLPLVVRVFIFRVSSGVSDAQVRADEVSELITQKLDAYHSVHAHYDLSYISTICRRLWNGGSLASNCTGSFDLSGRRRQGNTADFDFTTVAEVPVRGPVNWDLRIRDLAAEGEEDEDDEDPGS